jgi:hypothetical protein
LAGRLATTLNEAAKEAVRSRFPAPGTLPALQDAGFFIGVKG